MLSAKRLARDNPLIWSHILHLVQLQLSKCVRCDGEPLTNVKFCNANDTNDTSEIYLALVSAGCARRKQYHTVESIY